MNKLQFPKCFFIKHRIPSNLMVTILVFGETNRNQFWLPFLGNFKQLLEDSKGVRSSFYCNLIFVRFYYVPLEYPLLICSEEKKYY